MKLIFFLVLFKSRFQFKKKQFRLNLIFCENWYQDPATVYVQRYYSWTLLCVTITFDKIRKEEIKLKFEPPKRDLGASAPRFEELISI